MEGQKMWEVKEVRAANVRQAKRYAERWCAARLYPDLPLRQAVARLTDSTPIQPEPPLPGLPPTREQQQQAGVWPRPGKELERVKELLEPRRPLALTKPKLKGPATGWVRAGREPFGRGGRGTPRKRVCSIGAEVYGTWLLTWPKSLGK